MSTRISTVTPGEGADDDVNGLIGFAGSDIGFKDPEMFGLFARSPALLKAIGPAFAFIFAGQTKIPMYIIEMMRLKAAEINSCAY
ncbi:MAG: hypothetical protein IIC64_19050 [SAR324 cluster bacterium]|nr:hypothetical protein [SAR324 cluster bacterium]